MNQFVTGLLVLMLIIGCKEQTHEAGESGQTRAAANDTERNIYRAADSMLAAFNRQDWITFVKYNHPNMTRRMGDAEAFASFVNMQWKQIPDSTDVTIAVGKILQVVKTTKDVQCLVEQNMKMEREGSSINKTTYLIGESLDNGSTWTFFDASTKTGLSPKDIKPDISNELKIPATKNAAQ